MNLTLAKWLTAQCHRNDSIGDLARQWVSRGKTETNAEGLLAGTVTCLNRLSTVEQIRREYAVAVDCLNRGESAPTFPRVFASDDYERKLEVLARRHRAESEVSSDVYLRRKHLELQKALKGRTLIYLDTNHWINLRHVFIGSRRAQKEYETILSLLSQLVKDRRVLCPISLPLFLELMSQSDLKTRKATAQLMQEFSEGVCIQNPDCLEELELRQQAMKHLLGKEAPDLNEWIWTKVCYVGGELLPHNKGWSDADGDFIRKFFIDAIWDLSLEYFIDIEFGSLPHEVEGLIAEATNEDAAWYRNAKLPYSEVLANERAYRVRRLRDKINQIAQELWNEYPDHRDMDKATPPKEGTFDPWTLPSLQVLAGVNAALIRSGKRFSRNDILDFQHAALSVPYCDALFCDTLMSSTLCGKPLEFGQTYDTTILSCADEISAYLARLVSS